MMLTEGDLLVEAVAESDDVEDGELEELGDPDEDGVLEPLEVAESVGDIDPVCDAVSVAEGVCENVNPLVTSCNDHE